MYTDPIARIRVAFESEIKSHYRYSRKLLLQQLRGEITRPQIDTDQIVRYIDQNLIYTGNRVMDSAWIHIDTAYRTGFSNSRGMIGTHTSIVSSYSQSDKTKTDTLIDDCYATIDKQNQALKADILKQVSKEFSVNALLKSIDDQILNRFVPSVITSAQTYAGTAYNEAVWSQISKAAPYKRWCFVSDYQGNEYHLPANDIQTDIDQPFIIPAFAISQTKEVPEIEMMYPHDRKKKPHPLHVNDCRCYVEAVF